MECFQLIYYSVTKTTWQRHDRCNGMIDPLARCFHNTVKL